MNFGLFVYCQGRGVPHDQAYGELLEQIVLAERLGFAECWFAEHHFSDYSLLPSPNLLIASALQRTERMRFGNYVNVLPFHHPLRLAAEAATLDNLAHGRFDFGIGKGARPVEFDKFGLDRAADAEAMTDEATDILVKAWTQDCFSHAGRYWQIPETSLRPRPYQRPHPPLHLAAMHVESVVRAAERGWPVAMHFTALPAVADFAAGYRAALGRRVEPPGMGPYRPRVVLVRETFVGRTDAEARAVGELALLGFWHLSALLSPPPPTEFSDARLKELTARVWGGKTYDELDALGGMLIGSPAQMRAKVDHLEAIGIDTLLLSASFGNLTHAHVCRSLEAFADAIIRPRAVAAPAAARVAAVQ